MPASPGKCRRSSSTKAWVEPESNQTSQMSSTFFQFLIGVRAEERSRAPSMIPGVGAFLFERVRDALR